MCECVCACITYTHAGVTLPAAPLFRSFCGSFSLVGESQEIERIMQHFADRYHEENPTVFPDSSTIYGVVCAVLLLNSDLHIDVSVMSQSCHCHVTVLSLSCHCRMTVMSLSCDCHVTSYRSTALGQENVQLQISREHFPASNDNAREQEGVSENFKGYHSPILIPPPTHTPPLLPSLHYHLLPSLPVFVFFCQLYSSSSRCTRVSRQNPWSSPRELTLLWATIVHSSLPSLVP